MVDEPYKRRKLSEDLPRTLNEVLIQNSLLSSTVSEVSRAWAALIADLDSMLRSVTSYQGTSDAAAAFDFSFVRYPNTDEAIERLSELLQAKFKAFVGAIQQVPSAEPFSRLSEQPGKVLQIRTELNAALSDKALLLDKVHMLTDQVEKLKVIKQEIDSVNLPRTDYHTPSSQLKDLSDKLERIVAEKDSLRQQRDEYIERLQKIQVELEVSEERFVRSKAFALLTKQAKGLAQQLKEARDKQDSLQRWKTDQQTIRQREIAEAERREEGRRAELVKKLKDLQTEHAEVVNERAELQLAVEQLKREQAQVRHMDEYRSLIDDIEGEKVRLKRQVAELRRQNDELTDSAEGDLKRILELKDQLHILETSAVPHGEHVVVEHYGRELGEVRDSMKAKDNQIATLEKKVSILQSKLAKEVSTSHVLIDEIEVTNNAFAEAVKKNRTLTSQLTEQEQNFARLMSEQRKDSHWKTLHDAEKTELMEVMRKKDEAIERQRALVKEYEQRDASQQHEIALLVKKLTDAEDRLRDFARSHEDSFRHAEELAKAKQDGHASVLALERKLIVNTTQYLQSQFQQSQLTKELDAARVALSRSRSNDVYLSDLAVSAELAKLRKMVRCNVCCSRPKDVVLTSCLHAFCRVCIEKCISMQKRKCPHCLLRFTSEDVRALWWK